MDIGIKHKYSGFLAQQQSALDSCQTDDAVLAWRNQHIKALMELDGGSQLENVINTAGVLIDGAEVLKDLVRNERAKMYKSREDLVTLHAQF
jgi:hypothetical protein